MYRLLQLKIFFLQTLFTIFSGGVLAGFYHLGYFILNLSEWLHIETEKFFIYGYLLILLAILVVAVLKVVETQRNLTVFLENNFNLNFSWYNAVHEYQGGEKVPLQVAEEILKPLHFKTLFNAIFLKTGIIIILGTIGWSTFLLLPLFLPTWHNKYRNNIVTIWNYQEPYLELSYPREILTGDSFTLRYEGGYSEAKFSAVGILVDIRQLNNGEEFTLINVSSSFTIDYVLTKGRIKKNGNLSIKVWQPPKLTESTITVFDPLNNQSSHYSLSGIFSTAVNPKSRVQLVLNYQDDQYITNVVIRLKDVKARANINSPKVTLKYNNLPQVIMSETVVLNDQEFTITSFNQHGQESDSDTFTLTLRRNNPPSVAITSPENLLSLDKAAIQTITFVAKDDLALSQVGLFYQITTKKKRTAEKVLITLPRASTDKIKSSSSEPTLFSLLVSNITLPLTELLSPPGSSIMYYLHAIDNEGIIGYSATNQITINTLEKSYAATLDASERVSEKLNDRKSDFDNIQRDYEKLKIQGETKNLNTQDLKNFQENLNELSQKVQEDISKIDELEKDGVENKQIFSENFQKKLQELKSELSKIDQNYLQHMNQNFETLINNFDENLKPEEINKFLNQLDLKQMEQRVEQTLNYLKNLQQLQKLDTLEKLSQNLYLRYKDLESYMVAELLNDEQINQESASIKEGLEFIKKEFSAIKSELPDLPQTQETKRKIEDLLKPTELSAFDKLAQEKNQDNFLKERSEHLDELRRNFAKLNSFNQSLDQARVINTLNEQIIRINEELTWVERLLNEKVIDLNVTSDEKKFSILTQFLSKHKTLIYNFRESMFLLSSAATLEIDFMEMYDKLILNFAAIERKISPDQQSPEQNHIVNLNQNFLLIKNNLATLTRELILLKNIFNKIKDVEQNNMSMSRAIENQRNLNQRIQNLLQQGNLSEREKQYLRNLALEQNLLRSMMEQTSPSPNQQGNQHGSGAQGEDGQGDSEGNNGSSGNTGSNDNGKNSASGNGKQNNSNNSTENGTMPQSQLDENIQQARNNRSDNTTTQGGISDKRRREIIDQMKQLERELSQQNPDLVKIAELQKNIDANLFQANTGFQKEQEQKNEERIAEREKSIYQNTSENSQLQNIISKKSTDKLDQLKHFQNSLQHGDYRKRIERFIELNGS